MPLLIRITNLVKNLCSWLHARCTLAPACQKVNFYQLHREWVVDISTVVLILDFFPYSFFISYEKCCLVLILLRSKGLELMRKSNDIASRYIHHKVSHVFVRHTRFTFWEKTLKRYCWAGTKIYVDLKICLAIYANNHENSCFNGMFQV